MKPSHSLLARSTASLSKVAGTHCQLIKLGTIRDIYTANNILCWYTKCRQLGVALKLFEEMPERDTVSWNSMISGYVNSGNLESTWELLKGMKRSGFRADEYTYGSILKGVAFNSCIFLGQLTHSDIVKRGYEENVYSASALLDMYAKCGRIGDAHMVFDCMPERNSVSWNALIAGYAEIGDRSNCFQLLRFMGCEGARLDDGTFAPILTLLDDPKLYKLTTQLHATIIKYGLAFDNTAYNAMITAYSESGSIEDAERVFDGASGSQDLVSWNSMLAAYLAHDQESLAFELFLEMQWVGFEPDIYTYTSIISACMEEPCKNQGKSLHCLVIKKGIEQSIPVSNSLIAMYLRSNNDYTHDAIGLFESMKVRDRVSWNSILTGLSQNGSSENIFKFFKEMQSSNLEIDHYAFSAVLRSCADLATLQLGQQIHSSALKSGFDSNEFVGSSLIFMYSKCGIIEDARKSFDATPKNSSVTWNSIMFGYAQHGQGEVALNLFYSMREQNVALDHITFVAILTACSHIGFVEEGSNFLNSMESIYGITPRMEHYACAIDLYGRAGQLEKAKSLFEAMPFNPNAMVLKTLLGACRVCGDIELATKVAKQLLEMEPEEHCTYVILSDMYGNFKKWDEVGFVKRLMRDRGVKKVPGWSWVEVKNQVHSFNADDHSHSHFEEIYKVLRDLTCEIKGLKICTNLEIKRGEFGLPNVW